MITILFAYRNREISRIKKSLDSLKNQSNQNFIVEFVDYGSDFQLSQDVKKLIDNYNFVNYTYYYTSNQPWNKAKALNSVIKNLKKNFFFVADIDMIFHPQLIEKLLNLQRENTAVFFKVGYLDENESKQHKNFDDYNIKTFGTEGATGMTMFPVKPVQNIRGYDEFYHFWGSEDTDLHERLKNNGLQVQFYDAEVLMLHQWHKSYMVKERSCLTPDLQINNIIQINYQHLLFAKKEKKNIVNFDKWGDIPSKKDFDLLEKITNKITVDNRKEKIEDLFFAQLPLIIKEGVSIKIHCDDFQNSLKYKIKKVLGKKVPNYYSLKEINDKLLIHIISLYRNHAYNYIVSEDLKSINFTIKSNI